MVLMSPTGRLSGPQSGRPPSLLTCRPMHVDGAVVVVTGGGGGIGAALCRRFAAGGAAGVVVADIDGDAAAAIAREAGGLPVRADMGSDAGVRTVVDAAEGTFGRIDLFCANAAVTLPMGGVDLDDAVWDRMWAVNLRSHVQAVRAVLPGMLTRGSGYLLHTSSGAGLLAYPPSAPYTVTKAGVIALAELLRVTYGPRGIGVSCLVPLAVETEGMRSSAAAAGVAVRTSPISPDELADIVVEGLATDRFLILSHPEAADWYRFKSDDHERWLRGMRAAAGQYGKGGDEAS